MIRAILDANIDTVEEYIRGGASVNRHGMQDESINIYPIHAACESDNLDMVKYIVGQGADVNKCGTDCSYPIFISVNLGNLEITEYLLSRGAIPNCITRYRAEQEGFHEPGEYENILVTAIPYPEIFELLLQYGADPDAIDEEGRSVLYFTSTYDDHRSLDILLRHGCDVNARDYLGNTMLAYVDSDETLTKKLISHGANPRITNYHGQKLNQYVHGHKFETYVKWTECAIYLVDIFPEEFRYMLPDFITDY